MWSNFCATNYVELVQRTFTSTCRLLMRVMVLLPTDNQALSTSFLLGPSLTDRFQEAKRRNLIVFINLKNDNRVCLFFKGHFTCNLICYLKNNNLIISRSYSFIFFFFYPALEPGMNNEKTWIWRSNYSLQNHSAAMPSDIEKEKFSRYRDSVYIIEFD